MRTKAERMVLSQVVAAHTFKMFSVIENRGPRWKKESMPRLIKGQIEICLATNNIPEKHFETMTNDAIVFYNRYLESSLI